VTIFTNKLNGNMSNKALLAYLNEFKAELQEMFEDFDSELSHNENDDIYRDAYEVVGRQIEEAIDGVDTLVSDIEDGKCDDYVDDGIDYQEDSGNE
jgi:hypothetical protein